jgi:hypothetical protein
MNQRLFGILAVLALSCTLLLIASDLLFGTSIMIPEESLPAGEDAYIEMAQNRVKIGQDRDKALAALSDAWAHAECYYPSGNADDLFFYGAREPGEVRIILVVSTPVQGKRVVKFVGIVEEYLLRSYDHCVPSPLQILGWSELTETATPSFE